MPTVEDTQQFTDRAHENRLHISFDDAAAIGNCAEAIDAACSAIREIDITDLEPAAIFVPTPSVRE